MVDYDESDYAAEVKEKPVCRFCLSQEDSLTNIYSVKSNANAQVSLSMQIMACVSIEVCTQSNHVHSGIFFRMNFWVNKPILIHLWPKSIQNSAFRRIKSIQFRMEKKQCHFNQIALRQIGVDTLSAENSFYSILVYVSGKCYLVQAQIHSASAVIAKHSIWRPCVLLRSYGKHRLHTTAQYHRSHVNCLQPD